MLDNFYFLPPDYDVTYKITISLEISVNFLVKDEKKLTLAEF